MYVVQTKLQKLVTFRDIGEELVGYIKRVAELDIVKIHKLLNCIPSNMMHLFSHLKNLIVKECECLEEIFESNDDIMIKYLLINMRLLSLPKMKHIWKTHDQILAFQNLEWITIKQCDDLKYVFSDVSMATSLPSLNYLEVCECKKMEEIVGNNCVKTQHEAKIRFPSLEYIVLKKLPSLKCFSQSSFLCYVEMPQCFSIRTEDCPEMKTFWYKGIIYTPKLYEISVENTIFDKYEDVNEVIQQNN